MVAVAQSYCHHIGHPDRRERSDETGQTADFSPGNHLIRAESVVEWTECRARNDNSLAFLRSSILNAMHQGDSMNSAFRPVAEGSCMWETIAVGCSRPVEADRTGMLPASSGLLPVYRHGFRFIVMTGMGEFFTTFSATLPKGNVDLMPWVAMTTRSAPISFATFSISSAGSP